MQLTDTDIGALDVLSRNDWNMTSEEMSAMTCEKDVGKSVSKSGMTRGDDLTAGMGKCTMISKLTMSFHHRPQTSLGMAF